MTLRSIANFVTLLASYTLFAGQLSTDEALAGVPLAAAVTAYASLVHRVRRRDLCVIRAPWIRLVSTPAISLLPDAARLGRVLVRCLWRRPEGSVGSVSRQSFRSGGEDAADARRRGLVTLAISVAPNGYALELPGAEDVLVLHRLVDVRASTDREWLL